ncbi:MAG: AzlD domain-containing protein [Stenotrophomonas sp.]
MTLWAWIAAGCVAAWAIKFAGYLVPVRWLESPRMNRVAGCLTIGLLASLTTMNTVSAGQGLAFDARIGALLVAAAALMLRAPFLLVVIVGATAAALIRLL